MTRRIALRSSQRALATLWFLSAIPTVSLVMIQYLAEVYGEGGNQVISWLCAHLLPTLLLILGVLTSEELSHQRAPRKADRTVDMFFFRLTVGISIFYLLAVFTAALLSWLLHLNSPAGRVRLLVNSSAVLSMLQGVVGAALGVFFVRASRESTDSSEG